MRALTTRFSRPRRTWSYSSGKPLTLNHEKYNIIEIYRNLCHGLHLGQVKKCDSVKPVNVSPTFFYYIWFYFCFKLKNLTWFINWRLPWSCNHSSGFQFDFSISVYIENGGVTNNFENGLTKDNFSSNIRAKNFDVIYFLMICLISSNLIKIWSLIAPDYVALCATKQNREQLKIEF